jgi:hypothetical protein
VTQQLMRHRSLASTMRYTKVADARLAAAVRALPRLGAARATGLELAGRVGAV